MPVDRDGLHAFGGVARVEVPVRVLVEVELAALAAEVVRGPVVLAREGRRLSDDLRPTDRVDRDRHAAASWMLRARSPVLPGSICGGLHSAPGERRMRA